MGGKKLQGSEREHFNKERPAPKIGNQNSGGRGGRKFSWKKRETAHKRPRQGGGREGLGRVIQRKRFEANKPGVQLSARGGKKETEGKRGARRG